MIDEPMISQCCFLEAQNMLYSQSGGEIIYHRKEAELQCKKGWTGRNCDSCVKNFGPTRQCDQCLRGWSGEMCDSCDPNFEPEGECSRCRTGWAGNDCRECAPGWLPPDCSTCRFRFNTTSNCTECI